MRHCLSSATFLVLLALVAVPAFAEPDHPARTRVREDAAAGKTLVAHVTVALCDNENQKLVPVPAHLGNGQDPASNLYWGALYGVNTFLTRKAGWESLEFEGEPPEHVLERMVLTATLHPPDSASRTVVLVADAWDGAHMREAIERFQQHLDGRATETLTIKDGTGTRSLPAGGNAHLLAFVGHDGLMEFPPPRRQQPLVSAPARAAVVLACESRKYFGGIVQESGAQPLLLTNHFMAPEAYTLDAAVRTWFAGGSDADVREAAAQAYNKYQKCGIAGARLMFAEK